jgi:hypothetical protein
MLVVGLALFSQRLLPELGLILIIIGSLALSTMSRLGLLSCVAALAVYGLAIAHYLSNGRETSAFDVLLFVAALFFLVLSWFCSAVAAVYQYWQSRKAL